MTAERVLFQGQEGAYSEEAVRTLFPQAKAIPRPTVQAVFDALRVGEAEYACLPLENTTAGRVGEVQLLLPRYSFPIVQEYFLPIRHHLLAPEGASIRSIRRVRSHPQALAQCSSFLARHRWVLEPVSDTAGAAAEVAARGDVSCAAIASQAAAKRYRLRVLARNIHDADHNTTRFVVLARTPPPHHPPATVPTITALWFVLRSVPAALYKAIGGFATAGINLTKIESHLTGERFSRAAFYVEVEGHPETPPMHHALHELSFFAEEVRVLGVFPAHPYRRGGGDN